MGEFDWFVVVVKAFLFIFNVRISPAEAIPLSSAQDHLPRNLRKTKSLKRPHQTKALFAHWPALAPKAFQRLPPSSSSLGEHWEV